MELRFPIVADAALSNEGLLKLLAILDSKW